VIVRCVDDIGGIDVHNLCEVRLVMRHEIDCIVNLAIFTGALFHSLFYQ